MRLLIVGAGGHAKVVADAALSDGVAIAGIVGAPDGVQEILDIPVSRSADGITADAFIVAIGENGARAQAYAEYLARGLAPAVVIHPSAVISPSATFGAGTFVAAGVVVNPGARIGANAILNTACTVDHDCEVGNHAHIGPGAHLCGAVTVGESTLIGVGASATPGAHIGSRVVVGAGAAVTGDLPSGTVCVGVPARPVRSDGAAL